MVRLGVGKAVHQAEQACGDEQDPRYVKFGVLVSFRTRQQEDATDESESGEEQVDVQRPAPVQVLGEQSAQEQSHGAAGAGERTVDAERPGPLPRIGEGGGEQGQGRRCEQRAEQALAGPCGSQHAEPGGGAGHGGGGGEAGQPHKEGDLAAEQIGDASTQKKTARSRSRSATPTPPDR